MESLQNQLNIKNQIPKNQIDIPSYDLRNLEAMERVLSNLQILQDNIGKNTNSINSQIGTYKDKIGQFIERINLCKRKIQALNSLNAALPFVSPTKFPIPYKFQVEDGRKTVYQDIKKPPVFNKFDPRDSNKMIHNPEEIGKYSEIYRDDNFQYFNLTSSSLQQRRRNLFEGKNAITKLSNFETLGEAPRKCKYAETFLVFNTKMNPYKHYSNMQNLIITPEEKRVKERRDPEQIQLVDAPKTLQDNERLVMYSASNYNYKPTVKEMPNTLNMLPTGLDQFMGGIVSMDGGNFGDVSSFAPSQDGLVQKRQLISDNQNFGNDGQSNQINNSPYNQNQQQQTQPNNQQTQQYSQPQQTSGGPPSLQSIQQPQQNVQSFQPPPMNTLNQNSGPPPLSSLSSPPPLNSLSSPPPLNQLSNNQGPPPLNMPPSQQSQQPQQASEPPAPSRNALLDQIRNPTIKLRKRITVEKGGINLKNDGPAEVDQGPKPAGGGGGSLMDNLKAQINIRFHALNPKQKETKVTAKTKQYGSGSSEEENEDDEE